jgi:hypothetical protein
MFVLPFQVLLRGQLLKIWLYQAGFLVESCLGISHGRTFEAENKVGILIIHSHSIMNIRITSSQTVNHSQHLSSIIFMPFYFSRVYTLIFFSKISSRDTVYTENLERTAIKIERDTSRTFE